MYASHQQITPHLCVLCKLIWKDFIIFLEEHAFFFLNSLPLFTLWYLKCLDVLESVHTFLFYFRSVLFFLNHLLPELDDFRTKYTANNNNKIKQNFLYTSDVFFVIGSSPRFPSIVEDS